MSTSRSLVSYLVIPRTEGLFKALWVAPTAYVAVSFLAETAGGIAFGATLAVWAVFELGLYTIRYLINDVVDAEVDREHVAADRRGRAPDHPGAQRWTAVAIGLRVAAAVVVLVVVPPQARAILILATLVLVGVTLAYEAARTAIRRQPLDVWQEAQLSRWDLAVFALVGTGYGLRAALGAALAGGVGWVIAASSFLGWALGLLMVVMFWTVEAAALRLGGGEAVLARKSHIAVLARLLGERPDRLRQPLLVGAPARLAGLLFALTSGAAILFAVSLGTSLGPGGLVLLLVSCSAVSPALVATWPSVWAGPAAMVVNLVAALVLADGSGRVGLVVVLVYFAALISHWRTVTLRSQGLGRLVAEPSSS